MSTTPSALAIGTIGVHPRGGDRVLELVERRREELCGTTVRRGGRAYLEVDRTIANTDWRLEGGDAPAARGRRAALRLRGCARGFEPDCEDSVRGWVDLLPFSQADIVSTLVPSKCILPADNSGDLDGGYHSD